MTVFQLCQVEDWGLIDYLKAYQIQKQKVTEVLAGRPHVLILCEHPLVFTLGRLYQVENLLWSREELIRHKYAVIPIDRGGDVTLHSPGQLICYPIFNLNSLKSGKDLRDFLRKLEQVAIDLLKDFDILANRIFGRTGVFVGQEKIVSLGIGVKKWVTFHGMAINVSNDLNLFGMIRPCGLNVQMTSIERIKNNKVALDAVKERLIHHMRKDFNFSIIERCLCS